ncbi:dihydropteroate synthase [Lagierella sp.]|uniref:dihydropteroate synthase n=1 Tax=Lagierella sp. TaxID=2849657 RepID=UPI002624CABF|nr:dihydropteroate synthase [Lagierella sp.]
MKRIFKYKEKTIESGGSTILCGIVNVTPDSFSDGGKWFDPQKAIAHGLELVEQGATMLDIGGESTRPGATKVEVEEEINRVIPVIRGLKEKTDVLISIDTWKSEVAKAAIEAGVDIVNDITGLLGDPDMGRVLGESNVGIVAMFNPVILRPNHPSSKAFMRFGGEGVFTKDEEDKAMDKLSILDSCKLYFEKTLAVASKYNIEKERIMLDPGIGFGLTKRENLELIKNFKFIHEWNMFAFIGVSRKRFIVNILQESGFNMDSATEEGFTNRDDGSAALTAIAATMGAEALRVHVIPRHKIAADIADSVRMAESTEDINFEGYKN